MVSSSRLYRSFYSFIPVDFRSNRAAWTLMASIRSSGRRIRTAADLPCNFPVFAEDTMETPSDRTIQAALHALRNQQRNLELEIVNFLELLKSMPEGKTLNQISAW
jgi:hypothetical protein